MTETCAPEVYLDEQLKKALVNRLNRIEGQVRGVKKMLDRHESCDGILIQLAAIKSAVNGAARQLFEGHMETCVWASLRSAKGEESFYQLKTALAHYLGNT